MEGNFDRALQQILRSEGGYVNHPRDPGGCTNKGITLNTMRAHFPGEILNCSDVRNISMRVVEEIYLERYWNEIDADSLPSGLDLAVFDMAVNAGPGRAAKLLQRVVGTDQDGYVGPATLKAVSSVVRANGVADLIEKYGAARRNYYRGLSHFPTFGEGWMRRVEETEAAAITLTAVPMEEEPVKEEEEPEYSEYLSDLHAAMLKAINAAFVEAYAQAEEREKSA